MTTLRLSKWKTESELVQAIVRDLYATGLFSSVESEVRLNGMIVDILAEPARDSDANPVAFEIKLRQSIDANTVKQAAGYRELLRTQYPDIRLILVAEGQLTQQARIAAQELGLTVYAAEGLLEGEWSTGSGTVSATLRDAIGVSPVDSRADRLLQTLQDIPLGTPGWTRYQNLCGDILQYLFCPPLDQPIYENPDAVRRNRRDLIFGNPCQEGFWDTIRRDYLAHYIVVDAKNKSTKVDKNSILQIAHYLKPYGCGLFGIISSRLGVGPAALNAMREQWISSQKMIVVVSDEDIADMLRLKASGNEPEEIIRSIIARFRMSL